MFFLSSESSELQNICTDNLVCWLLSLASISLTNAASCLGLSDFPFPLWCHLHLHHRTNRLLSVVSHFLVYTVWGKRFWSIFLVRDSVAKMYLIAIKKDFSSLPVVTGLSICSSQIYPSLCFFQVLSTWSKHIHIFL